MFPSLAAQETYVAETSFASWKQGNVSESSQKNIFVSQTQIFLPKRLFPSLATQGNMSGKNISSTMFPSLARPLGSSRNAVGDYGVRD